MQNIVSKIWKLLTDVERKKAIGLFFMILVSMVLETVSVGLILPLVGFLNDKEYLNQFPFINSILYKLGNPSHELIMIFVMLLLILVYVAKNSFLSVLMWKQMKFVHELRARLSQRLFTNYLKKPYTFHLQRNSAQLIRNAFSEVGTVVGAGILPIIYLLTEGCVIIGLIFLLTTIEPIGAITTVILMSVIVVLFYKFTKDRLFKWGEQRHLHEGMRIQHLQQGIAGVKDIILLGRESDFLNQYMKHNTASANVLHKQAFMQQLPRLFMEVIAVFFLATLIIVLIMQEISEKEILPIVSIFVAAAFRLMPSSNRILNAIQSIRFGLPAINNIYEEIVDEGKEIFSNNILNKEELRVFSFNDVNYRYPSVEKLALENISFSFKKGQTIGIVGESGAGKSTLIDIFLGLLTPNGGSVCVDEIEVHSSLRWWQDKIGYVPQDIYLTDDTLKRNIAFGLPDEKISENALNECIEAAQLVSFFNTLQDGVNTIVGERGIRLSGGQKQRIGIARALYHNPEILVLDEATSSLDTKTEMEVMKAINDLHGKKTIIIIAHRISTVQGCDFLVKLKDGYIERIGSYEQLYT